MKTERAYLGTQVFHDKSMGQSFSALKAKACYSKINKQICLEFKLVQDFTPVPVTCKFDEDPIKMVALSCPQHCFHYKLVGNNQHSRVT